MRITVEYMAQVRRVRGLARETVEIDTGATVANLLQTLARQDATLAPMILDEGGSPQRSLLVFVRDEQVDTTRSLNDGDVVTLLTPMAGGAGRA